MPTPKEVFDDPDAHWEFLTLQDDNFFEGQHFDRKETGRPGTGGQVSNGDLRRFRVDHIACTISAFANSNRDGGLLVLGIMKDGGIAGLAHLSEAQRNAIGNPDDIVIGHKTRVSFHQCVN
jgi:hypothetical protein